MSEEKKARSFRSHHSVEEFREVLTSFVLDLINRCDSFDHIRIDGMVDGKEAEATLNVFEKTLRFRYALKTEKETQDEEQYWTEYDYHEAADFTVERKDYKKSSAKTKVDAGGDLEEVKAFLHKLIPEPKAFNQPPVPHKVEKPGFNSAQKSLFGCIRDA